MTEALRDKMKYLRNSKPRSKKTARKEDQDVLTPSKKARKEFEQFPQSPAAPDFPDGEDEASMLRHIKLLQLEEKKVSPNKTVVESLMAKTFSFRRQELLNTVSPVNEILQKYPSLRSIGQVSYMHVHVRRKQVRHRIINGIALLLP